MEYTLEKKIYKVIYVKKKLFFQLKNFLIIKMHIDNLLDLLPSELIPFILKYLSYQDLKNCCINDI